MLRKRREERRKWISDETWKKIDKRGAAKNDINTVTTRNQMRNAKRKYQEADKEVKRSCRKGKTNGIMTTI